MKASAGRSVLMLIENTTYANDLRVRHEAKTLVDAGYRVSVICQHDPRRPWREIDEGVYVYQYPAPPAGRSLFGYFWEYSYSFVAMFILSLVVWRERGFDVIHTANPPDTAVFIAMFYRLFHKQFVFDHHDLAPDMYLARSNKNDGLIYKVLLWMERVSFRFAHHVISTNHSYKNVAIERGGVPEEQITVVRNGPNLDRFRLLPPDPEIKKNGVAIIGYVGVMGPQDGLDYLLRALQQLMVVIGRKDFQCFIIGKGSALPELKSLALKMGLEQHVCFTGFISDADVLRILSSSDICVDPDPSNSFNDRCTMIKMMEYMALGKPIVAFDLPEHRVTACEAALYARPNEELDFAQKICSLMDDPSARKRMGAVGRERVEKSLAWTHQKENLLHAYRVLDQKRDLLR